MARSKDASSGFSHMLSTLRQAINRGNPQAREQAVIAKAEACLANGQPEKALELLKPLDKQGGTFLNSFHLKIRALLKLRRYDEAAKVALRASRLKKLRPRQKAEILTALLRGGAIGKAERMLDKNLKNAKVAKLLKAMVVASLQSGRPEFVMRYRNEIRANDVQVSQCVSRALENHMVRGLAQDKAALAEIEIIIAAAGDICALVTDIAEACKIGTILYWFGESEAADRYLNLFTSLAAEHPALALPWQKDLSVRAGRPRSHRGQRIEALANWLEIPQGARAAWMGEVRENPKNYDKLLVALYASGELYNEFADMVEPPDWEPVLELAKQGKPAVLVTTHLGSLMGTFTQFAAQKLPVSIIGGSLMAQKLMPRGDIFLPFPIVEPDTKIARKIIKRLKAGRMVAISPDGLRGAGVRRYFKDGHMFHLSESAARICMRNQVPVFWVCTYWRDGKLRMEVEAAPAPRENEKYERFLRRFNDYYYRKSRAVALAGPRNVGPFANIVKTPNIFFYTRSHGKAEFEGLTRGLATIQLCA